jgi:hypothetical protein
VYKKQKHKSKSYNSSNEYSVKRFSDRTTMSISLCIILLCNICIPPINGNQYRIASSNLSGTFLEYLLDTHLIVLWNYTIDEYGLLETIPGLVLYENEDEPPVLDGIHIRVEISEYTGLDSAIMALTYSANIPTKYIGNQSIIIDYSFESGSCEIRNGTFSNRTGVFWLFANYLHELTVISRVSDQIVRVGSVDYSYMDIVLDEQQECFQYVCMFSHIVDGNVSHHRVYDKDTHVLVSATGGVSDFILLGLDNISYAVGHLSLIDTNLALGTPVKLQKMGIPAAIGVGSFGTFAVLYFFIYRAQRSKRSYSDSHKRKRKSSRRFLQVMQI